MKRPVFLLMALALLAFSCLQSRQEYSNTIAIGEEDSPETIISKAAHVVPSPNQMRALEREFIAFVHFGPNTFTANEWGSGFEDPRVFGLETLDTDQWCEAMKAAGMKMVVLTVKHHDGFVLWQSRYTDHGIMSCGFQDGKGDVFRSLSQSCAKYGLDLGFYLSPADLYQIESPDGLYGNLSKPSWRTIPRPVEGRPFEDKTTFRFCVDDYNEYYLNQLFELLTEYGPIKEVWLDGAHPKRKGGQEYDYHAWKEVIHTLAPEAVVFGREDVRWCGNEAGETRVSEWNVIPYQEDPDTAGVFHDMTDEDLASDKELLEAKYLHYQQAETDVSIRNGWFYRNDTEQEVRSADNVFDIYERSVGGNSTLILNIPPNREGRFSDRDILVLKEVGRRIRATYGSDLFVPEGKKVSKRRDSGGNPVYEVSLKEPVTFNRLVLQEDIAVSGERVGRHTLEIFTGGEWKEVASATNIGYKRILRFPRQTARRLRVRILESRAEPTLKTISAHLFTEESGGGGND